MERCNRLAWRYYESNGFRVCRDHARVNDPAEIVHWEPVGPCDQPMEDIPVEGEETETVEPIILHDVTGIARKGGTDQHGAAWLEFTVEEDEEICTECQEPILDSGWVCMDGGDVVCNEHVFFAQEDRS
jgi:hypothetical protein